MSETKRRLRKYVETVNDHGHPLPDAALYALHGWLLDIERGRFYDVPVRFSWNRGMVDVWNCYRSLLYLTTGDESGYKAHTARLAAR